MRISRFLTGSLVALSSVVVACGSDSKPAATTGVRASGAITVFAASSLTDVFPAIDKTETYSFAGSNTLATQITAAEMRVVGKSTFKEEFVTCGRRVHLGRRLEHEEARRCG